MFSVAIATVLFPSLARLARAATWTGFRSTVVARPAPDRVPAHPGGVVSAVLAEPIIAARLPARRTSSRRRRRSSPPRSPRSRSGLVFNGVDADAEPRVLQPAVELDPDVDRARRTSSLNAVLDAAFYRFGTWGIPLATSLVNIAGSGAAARCCADALGRHRARRDRSTPCSRIVVASVAARRHRATASGTALDRRARAAAFRGQMVSVVAALVAGTPSYLLACRALEVRELGALLALRSRLKRA